MLRSLGRSVAGLVIGLLAVVGSGGTPASAADLLVLAAATLRNVLDAVGAEWRTQTGKPVTFSYASSSTLAKQIEQGAPADIFVSADLDWMDYLQTRGLIKAGTRTNLLGNTLVLVAPADSARTFTLAKGADLGAFIGDGRLAVADVRSAPAGKYARQSLEALGMWSGVETRLAQNDTVRAALAFVARGEAAAGIVYATDAAIEPKVKVLGGFPADSHAPIVFPVAMLAAASDPDAAAFLAFLRSPAAIRIYEAQGFTVLQ